MKKRNLKVFALTMALCVTAALSGCAAHAATRQEPDKTAASNLIPEEQAYNSGDTLSSYSSSTAEDFESDEVISAKEQAKTEGIRRDKVAEQYSIYEPYGMTYNKEKDRFFYNGQVVRYFKDQVSAEHANAFYFDDGTVDVEPIRDTKGNLTGVEQSSDADFKARTEKQAEIKAKFDATGVTGESGSFELGDLNYRDDSLDTYIAFGVSYDQSTKKWMYDAKAIHILYDADYNTYCNNSVNDGVNLKVIRDKNGNIEKLVETEEHELEQYVK